MSTDIDPGAVAAYEQAVAEVKALEAPLAEALAERRALRDEFEPKLTANRDKVREARQARDAAFVAADRIWRDHFSVPARPERSPLTDEEAATITDRPDRYELEV